nr:MAG TPA: hypothetical protein [Caudoviricetes sp.]
MKFHTDFSFFIFAFVHGRKDRHGGRSLKPTCSVPIMDDGRFFGHSPITPS